MPALGRGVARRLGGARCARRLRWGATQPQNSASPASRRTQARRPDVTGATGPFHQGEKGARIKGDVPDQIFLRPACRRMTSASRHYSNDLPHMPGYSQVLSAQDAQDCEPTSHVVIGRWSQLCPVHPLRGRISGENGSAIGAFSKLPSVDMQCADSCSVVAASYGHDSSVDAARAARPDCAALDRTAGRKHAGACAFLSLAGAVE